MFIYLFCTSKIQEAVFPLFTDSTRMLAGGQVGYLRLLSVTQVWLIRGEKQTVFDCACACACACAFFCL